MSSGRADTVISHSCCKSLQRGFKKYFEIEMEMKGTREFLRPSTQKIE